MRIFITLVFCFFCQNSLGENCSRGNDTITTLTATSCEVNLASNPYCKEVEEVDKKRCDIGDGPIPEGKNLFMQCVQGVKASIADFINFIKGIFSSISKLPAAIGSAMQFFSIEYAKALETTWPPFKHERALLKISGKVFKFMGDAIFEMVKKEVKSFDCLNTSARTKKACALIAENFIPPDILIKGIVAFAVGGLSTKLVYDQLIKKKVAKSVRSRNVIDPSHPADVLKDRLGHQFASASQKDQHVFKSMLRKIEEGGAPFTEHPRRREIEVQFKLWHQKMELIEKKAVDSTYYPWVSDYITELRSKHLEEIRRLTGVEDVNTLIDLQVLFHANRLGGQNGLAHFEKMMTLRGIVYKKVDGGWDIVPMKSRAGEKPHSTFNRYAHRLNDHGQVTFHIPEKAALVKKPPYQAQLEGDDRVTLSSHAIVTNDLTEIVPHEFNHYKVLQRVDEVNFPSAHNIVFTNAKNLPRSLVHYKNELAWDELTSFLREKRNRPSLEETDVTFINDLIRSLEVQTEFSRKALREGVFHDVAGNRALVGDAFYVELNEDLNDYFKEQPSDLLRHVTDTLNDAEKIHEKLRGQVADFATPRELYDTAMGQLDSTTKPYKKASSSMNLPFNVDHPLNELDRFSQRWTDHNGQKFTMKPSSSGWTSYYPKPKVPKVFQGFKLHVTYPENLQLTQDVLGDLMELLAKHKVDFKHANAEYVRRVSFMLNVGAEVPPQGLKFVTIYPRTDEEALTIAREISEMIAKKMKENPQLKFRQVDTDHPLSPGLSVRYGENIKGVVRVDKDGFAINSQAHRIQIGGKPFKLTELDNLVKIATETGNLRFLNNTLEDLQAADAMIPDSRYGEWFPSELPQEMKRPWLDFGFTK